MRRHFLHIVLLLATTAAKPQGPFLPNDTLRIRQLLRQSHEPASRNNDTDLKLVNEALALAEKTGYAPALADAHFEAGSLYRERKIHAVSVEHFAKAETLYRQLQNEYQLAQTLKLMGDGYAARTYFRQASDHYREAINLLRKTGQQRMLVECTEAMGNIVIAFGRPKNAIGFYLRALGIKKTLNDESGIMATSSKLVTAYLETKQYDSALYYNHEVQRLAANNKTQLRNALAEEGIIYCLLQRLPEAENALFRAEGYLTGDAQNDEKIRIGTARAVYYLLKDDKTRVRQFLDSVGSMLTRSQNPETAITGLAYLAEMSRIKGDYKMAFEFTKSTERYKDILRSESIDRLRAEAENASEISLKEKEIEYLALANRLKVEQLSKEELQRMALLRENILKDSSIASQRLLMEAVESESALRNKQLRKEKELSLSLSRENELKQQLLNDEKQNRLMMLAGMGLLALLGAVIFYQYRRQRHKNTIIRRQTTELEVLNKEVHHRVKNNLQVISSMLDLQSQSLADAQAAAIIKEGIQRVQSMAFIHQNLYQGSSVNSVNMTAYIHMLSNHLFQTYNIQPEKIKLHTQIDNLQLHTDTAIPLGMILNELISNALKYAFRGRSNGDIWIAMKRTGNELLLQVRDNGVGMPAGFQPEKTNSFGYEIVNAFAQKLRARMQINSQSGTDVQLIISKFKTTETV